MDDYDCDRDDLYDDDWYGESEGVPNPYSALQEPLDVPALDTTTATALLGDRGDGADAGEGVDAIGEDVDSEQHYVERVDSLRRLCGYTCKILSQTGKGARGGYPEIQCKQCWHCTLEFDWGAVGCTDKYDSKRNSFVLFGGFCSLNCAKGYLLQRNTPVDRLRREALGVLYRRVRKLANSEGAELPLSLQPSPPRETLQRYGGPLSVAEYRQMFSGNPRRICRLLPHVEAVFFAKQPEMIVYDTEQQFPKLRNESAGASAREKQARAAAGGVTVNKRGITGKARTASGDAEPREPTRDKRLKMSDFMSEELSQRKNATEHQKDDQKPNGIRGGAGGSLINKRGVKPGHGVRLQRKIPVCQTPKGTLDQYMNFK